ncbi:ATPase [Pyrococcus sp. NA2]|uniref:AAA family ATPase n=1 Tax=Pyrococcus sp. (strain NA2) TaxID=342949 RepID=UPI000209AC14|nr:ATP-binding protein [Pyrococcus sp. NA2]AEC52738.1 ATPase [Pyrococcus sp. NA2]
MNSPFIYGRKVGKEHFADREEELEKLKLAIMSGQNVIIYSPRRYGKSSLVGIALEELRDKVYPIEVDCSGIITKKELAEKISSSALATWRGRIEDFIRKLFKIVRPRIVLGDKIKVEFSVGEEDIALDEALKIPQRLAEITGKKVVVVFDEFQEISNLGKDILPKMRAEFQGQKDVTFVFVGSKQGMMRKIFHSPKSPFYNFGMHMVLKRIPREKFEPFISTKFEESGLKIEKDVIEKILDITKGHPHYTQMICYHLWLNATISRQQKISMDDLKEIIDEILSETSEFFEEIWSSLPMNQRRVLVAIAKGERDLYSRDFMNRYGFNRASTVQVSLRALQEKELIIKENGKYLIENPLFELWILRITSGQI